MMRECCPAYGLRAMPMNRRASPKAKKATRSAAPAKPVMQNGTDAIVE
jgi:hypothetical protein